MLEGEQDLEQNVSSQISSKDIYDNDFYNEKIYLIGGFVVILNFIFSLDCNYGINQYLIVNSVLYTIFTIYVIRTNNSLRLFTNNYVIIVVILYVFITLKGWIAETCVPVSVASCPVCDVCFTQTPTGSSNTTG